MKSAEKLPGPVRIIGQGLAGTALAWEFERAGIEFQVIDRGHAGSASAVSAGLINPVTGQRFVKSWRVDELLPGALEFYRAVERTLGVSLLEPLRGWRIFRNATEAARYAAKHASGELAPYDQGPLESSATQPWCSTPYGAAGFGGVWRLEVGRYLALSRERWRAAGKLIETSFGSSDSEGRAGPLGPPGTYAVPAAESTVQSSPTSASPPITILCTGAALGSDPRVRSSGPLRLAPGELIELAGARVPPATMVNARHWFLPLADDRVLGGATYRIDGQGTPPEGVAELRRAAREILGVPGAVAAERSGVRLVADDKLPLAGWLDPECTLGVCAALGSKGALFSPWLAAQWSGQLRAGKPFAAEVSVGRASASPVPGG